MKALRLVSSIASKLNFLGLTSTMLMVSSRSSRSHSMDLRLLLNSLVVQSTSSLDALLGSCSNSSHRWCRPWAVFTASAPHL
uniref:Uncharacterized protein n=1 Tax=Anguilla anguilla TaxID=7936 RepID=A0A0E9SY14_ANGAN